VVISYNATSLTVKIKPDFSPATTFALTWFQLADGNWAATDRGAASDQYACDVRLYGKEADIDAFITFMEANRNYATLPNVLTLSGFNAQEKIFGCDVNYSGNILATAFMDRREQGSWKGWGVPLTLAAILPTFVAGGSFPILRNINVGVDADSDYTINKFDSYNRTFSYQEHSADVGSFTAEYVLNETEMVLLRRSIATTRDSTFPAPILVGIANPFGRRAYSSTVRIKDFEDQGMLGGFSHSLPWWQAKFTLVEAL
jgi:hypothetical protein